MNMAYKRLLCTFLGVLIINIVHSYRPTSPKNCNVPNGSRGVCTPLDKCQPLEDISNANDRTSSAYIFYIQSKALCTDKMVCCPPKRDWHSLNYKPIDFSVNDSTTENISNLDNLQVTKCGIQAPTQRIIGGDTVDIHEYPWLALLDYSESKKGNCAGNLITNIFIVTAAHCIENGLPVQVRLAEYNTSSYPTDTVIGRDGVPESINVTIIDVEWSKKHPSYEGRPNYANDIALIKMTKSIQFSDFIKPICLPDIDFVSKYSFNTQLITAGWGADETNEASNVKKHVTIPYRPLSECQLYIGRTLHEEEYICAGGENGKDSCRGDSGGPLMYKNGTRFVLVGIVSSGYYECGIGKPTLYTNVYNYLDWIKRSINEVY